MAGTGTPDTKFSAGLPAPSPCPSPSRGEGAGEGETWSELVAACTIEVRISNGNESASSVRAELVEARRRPPFDRLRVTGAWRSIIYARLNSVFSSCCLPSTALWLLGCATLYNPATGRTETVLDSPVEIALGNLAKAQMGLVSLKMGRVDPDEFQRVQRIGERLARVSDRKDVPYRFGAIRDKSLNAFALPGGTIYVHTGLLEKATDDELAAVLAHEVGHVAARHAAKHLQADLGFAVLLQLAAAGGAGNEPARVANSLYGLFRSGYSRQDELEADRLGLRYADESGYNPNGMVTFFEKLLEEHPESPLDKAWAWQRTHPLTTERIQKAKAQILRLQGERFCPTCGRAYGPGPKFCSRDGTALKPRRRSW